MIIRRPEYWGVWMTRIDQQGTVDHSAVRRDDKLPPPSSGSQQRLPLFATYYERNGKCLRDLKELLDRTPIRSTPNLTGWYSR